MYKVFSPKARYDFSKIFPFGLLFLITGWLFLITEIVATRSINTGNAEDIKVTWSIFLFASVAMFLFGLFIGFLEVVLLKGLFKRESLRRKIFSKLFLYFLFFMLIICLTYPIVAAMEMNLPLFSEKVFDRFISFLLSVTFFNTLFQLSVSLFISLIYNSISDNIGHSVLINFFTGRYAKPKEEIRIFMFLDMKSSTTIAEELGNINYFNFLSAYYEAFSDAIIEQRGEVYEYIGDEIVITWPFKKGIKDGNCIECFFKMKQALKERENTFDRKYGILPDFKAGIHLGRVTAGELGSLKKEITFAGDVLNTTSRIQALCSELKTDLVISKDLFDLVSRYRKYPFQSRGEINLKGKSKAIEIYAL